MALGHSLGVFYLFLYFLHFYLFINFDYSLVVTAVSPNVVVTVVLDLKAKRLGMYKGIHTLILAMTSCNDVVAIFVFGVLLGVVFSQGDLTQQLLQGPIGIAIGLVFGFIFGTLLIHMPSDDSVCLIFFKIMAKFFNFFCF